jgi:hypothetical protein
VGTRVEKVPAAQRVDPTALAQLGSRVLRQLRRSSNILCPHFISPQRTGPITTLVTGLMMSGAVGRSQTPTLEGCNLSARESLSRESVGITMGNRKQRKKPTTENGS